MNYFFSSNLITVSKKFLTYKTNLTNCQISQRMSGNVTISTNHSSWVA